jgi:hypothetical protein
MRNSDKRAAARGAGAGLIGVSIIGVIATLLSYIGAGQLIVWPVIIVVYTLLIITNPGRTLLRAPGAWFIKNHLTP